MQQRPSAIRIGRAARNALAPQRRGKVIARFARSFYVATGGGLACIGGDHLGNGPLNVVVPGLQRLPQVGESLRCTGDAVRFASGVEIVLSRARLWRARPTAPADRAKLRRSLAAIRSSVAPAEIGQTPGARALHQWLLRGARGAPPAEVTGLLGRGPGLTPAGDDLLGGALIALHACRRLAIAGRLARSILQRARRSTSRISHAHLCAAARGEGMDALHRMIASLLAGRSALGGELAALRAVGHSSGMDALAGAALVLDAFAQGAAVPFIE